MFVSKYILYPSHCNVALNICELKFRFWWLIRYFTFWMVWVWFFLERTVSERRERFVLKQPCRTGSSGSCFINHSNIHFKCLILTIIRIYEIMQTGDRICSGHYFVGDLYIHLYYTLYIQYLYYIIYLIWYLSSWHSL